VKAEAMHKSLHEQYVVGVDEAGRGPLAGPVVAAAVILPARYSLSGIGDSKQLTRKKRERLEQMIKEQAVCWTIGEADVPEIDTLNILQATLLAMSRAVDALTIHPELVLIDGCHAPELNCKVRTIVKGDVFVPSISAASILAKVHRDKMMIGLDHHYPQYGFATNMGYPTRRHLLALAQHGATAIHRRSFAPVRAVLRNFVDHVR
jgi:ribonuclease HII